MKVLIWVSVLVIMVFQCIVSLFAQEEIVFIGIPEIRINESGVRRISEKLATEKATEFECTITKIDDGFHWSSRENVTLLSTQSGIFTTFIATNGSGYIRIISGNTEKRFDYIEHLLLGLRTITYYGKSK